MATCIHGFAQAPFVVRENAKTQRRLRLGGAAALQFHHGIRQLCSPEEMAARGLEAVFEEDADFQRDPVTGEWGLVTVSIPNFPESLDYAQRKSATSQQVKNRVFSGATVAILAADLPAEILKITSSLPPLQEVVDARGVAATISPKLSPTPNSLA